MSPYMSEQLEILRRISERGLKLALESDAHDLRFVDLFQHLIDEIKRTREAA